MAFERDFSEVQSPKHQSHWCRSGFFVDNNFQHISKNVLLSSLFTLKK